MDLTNARLAYCLLFALSAWMFIVGTVAAKPTRLQRDRALAVSYWGRPCGHEPIPIFKADLDDYIAMALWDGHNFPYTDCKIVLDSNEWWTTLKLCSVIAHEYGHLTGHGHSKYYWALMYPYYVQPWEPCRRLWSDDSY